MSDTRPEVLREIAERVATDAAAFVKRRRAELVGGGPQPIGSAAVAAKSTRTDPVTVVDTETERFIRDRLIRLRPGDSILGEEGGGRADSDDGVCWVVDPIDGTVNFVYGIPAYAVSIGAQIGGIAVAGAVVDVVSGELYSASVGAGAHMTSAGNRREIRCSDVDELSMALLGTGFGYAPRRRTEQSRLLAKMLPLVRDVRRIGSASLDLCLVAAGRLDAHYEHGLQVWDWAAGAVIAAEAGAVVRLPQSVGSTGGAGLTLVSAPGIADELIATLDGFDGLAPLAT
ncbi:MAG: inositol monophosphatase family protein [Mycobacterium sp.]